MNILGITGLGVSPTACLIQDGRLVAMAEEERFNLIKGSFGLLPEKATQFCLSYKHLSLDDIDYIVFPWDTLKYRFYMPGFALYTYLLKTPKIKNDNLIAKASELLKYQPSQVKNALVAMLRKTGLRGKIPPIKFIPHHLAHAASTFYCSGFDQAYILVIDGSGEDKCTTIFKGHGLEIKELKCFRIPNSLGWFYQSVTEFLGFLPNRHEGKTMALAAYGKYNQEIYSKFEKIISFDKKGNYKYNGAYSFLGQHRQGTVYSEKMVDLFKKPRHYLEPIEQIHKDIAFAAQEILEKIVISIAKGILSFPDQNKNLCIAGGVGLNCKMNGMVADQNYIANIFIPPVSNDAGTALGGALYFSKKNGLDPRFKMEHAYWGPEFSNQQIEILLNKLNIKYRKDPEIAVTTAKLLAEDKIVGWFQGRMEIGPRALGARSILANPTKEATKNKVNNLKNRELWRPFAPSLLYEARAEYLLKPKESPFMALAFEVTAGTKEKIPSVVHTDNSTRVHLVKKEGNPKYWELIHEFQKISGVPVILNTSFNVQGEPIVCTPQDALKTFYATKIDCLAMGDFLISK